MALTTSLTHAALQFFSRPRSGWRGRRVVMITEEAKTKNVSDSPPLRSSHKLQSASTFAISIIPASSLFLWGGTVGSTSLLSQLCVVVVDISSRPWLLVAILRNAVDISSRPWLLVAILRNSDLSLRSFRSCASSSMAGSCDSCFCCAYLDGNVVSGVGFLWKQRYYMVMMVSTKITNFRMFGAPAHD